MDAGIMLNMLKGNAAANTPAVTAGYSTAASSASEHANVQFYDFPSMVEEINAQNPVEQANPSQKVASVTGMRSIFQTHSMSGTGKGIMQPEGTQNILDQEAVSLDPATIENILAQNKTLAGKLDSLIDAGDVEGFAAIMQNISAIVEQINTGEFDITNLEGLMLQENGLMLQENGSSVAITELETPSHEHGLSAIQAAARFQPLMQFDANPNSTKSLLPVDILIELADLGQSPLSGTNIVQNGH